MRIKQLLIGITASVIAISSYVELAVADLKFSIDEKNDLSNEENNISADAFEAL